MCSVHRANFPSKITQMERMTESGTSEPADPAAQPKLHLAPFPGENPTELEFKNWLDSARDRLRVVRFLKFALNAAPAAPAELAPKNVSHTVFSDAPVRTDTRQQIELKKLT